MKIKAKSVTIVLHIIYGASLAWMLYEFFFISEVSMLVQALAFLLCVSYVMSLRDFIKKVRGSCQKVIE